MSVGQLDDSSERDRALALIGRIYDGALQPQAWPRIIQEVVRFIGGTKGLLFTSMLSPGHGGFAFPYLLPESFLRTWADKYIEDDLWSRAAIEKGLYREGNTVLDSDLVGERDLVKSIVYREFMQPHGLGRLCSGVVFGAESRGVPAMVCSVFRDLSEACFGEDERERMHVLVPHLSRALGVMIRLRGAEIKTAASLAALDRLASGVLLLDGRGDISFANGAARQALQEADGLRLRAVRPNDPLGRLMAHNGREQGAIESAVAECLRPAALRVAHFSSALSISRPSGRRAYVLQFAPLPSRNEFHAGSESARAIAFLTDPAAAPRFDEGLLRQIYHLSRAEIRLAESLCAGQTIAAAAELSGVAVSTARTQLKNIFKKTGVSRQAELLRLLLALGSK